MVGIGPTTGHIPEQPSGPFAPGAKRPFYFVIEPVEQRLRLLKRLMAGRDALILVIGEWGSGKTTLMTRLIDTMTIPCRQGRFREPAEDHSCHPVPALLRTHPVFILKNMAQSTIILDDAHSLGPEELAFLLRIISPPRGVRMANRMVLFGEPSLNTNLSALIQGLPDATAVSSVYLPAMTPDETAAYLRQRLSAAGFADNTLFDGRMARKLHRAGGGLPGRINEEADRWLHKKMMNEKLTGRETAPAVKTLRSKCIGPLTVLGNRLSFVVGVLLNRSVDPGR
jgi:type II secretory pathway predicted ATPase ExeA